MSQPPKKTRRKSIRKEAVKVIMEGDKNRITVSLKRDGTPRTEIETKEANPDKISFGKVSDGYNRLEFASYDKVYAQNAYVFLNGERIMLDKYHCRKLIASVMKMSFYLGAVKKRKAKN
jgi:hypothetical protein